MYVLVFYKIRFLYYRAWYEISEYAFLVETLDSSSLCCALGLSDLSTKPVFSLWKCEQFVDLHFVVVLSPWREVCCKSCFSYFICHCLATAVELWTLDNILYVIAAFYLIEIFGSYKENIYTLLHTAINFMDLI